MDSLVNKKIRTYGRKKARGLSDRQSSALSIGLDSYKIDVPTEKTYLMHAFGSDVNYEKLIVEIGFGHGERLIDQAVNHPRYAFIGCEPFENGVAKAITKIQETGIKNVRIFMGDSRELLERASDKSVSEFYIMFPDPWPKKRHAKRRLVSTEFLELIVPLLLDDGFIRLASDCDHYIEHVIEVVKEHNANHDIELELSGRSLEELRNKPADWGETRYEKKAISKGRQCYYLTIFRRSN